MNQKNQFSNPISREDPKGSSSGEWWRNGFVWLVLSGPLVVIIASFFTASLAFSSKDIIVSDNDPKTRELANYSSLIPAQTASFHAATPDSGLRGMLDKPVKTEQATISNTAKNAKEREPLQ